MYHEYRPSERYSQLRNMGATDEIRLLPMSIFPGMEILQNFGLVDVQLIRSVYLPEDT